MIEVQNLSWRFDGTDDWALRDVDLHVAQGELMVITGSSGGGKSTLVLAIGGYLFQQYAGEATGSVRVGGLDVREHPLYEVADVVGLVQQNPEAQFCTLTVEEEVAFGLENRCLPPAEIERRLSRALDLVGAVHLRHRSLATLSGGEKQRVAIAAVMAAEPRVLILDEPTSSLDPTATAEVFGVLADLCRQQELTVIVVEHKLAQLLPLRPRVAVLEGGRVVADGPVERLLPAWGTRWGLERSGKRPVRPPRNGAEPLVVLDGVRVRYNGRVVLDGLSLRVELGEVVAVMGDNGAGKSTLLRCLLGLVRPDAGRVEVLGRDVAQTPTSVLAQQFGLVFQNPDHQLFADTVWEEAVFAARNFELLDGEARDRAEALLARSGLLERRSDHPYRLSYGQKRRLNLASAAVHTPRLLLLDEPLIGQDWANVEFLMGQVRQMAADGAAVLVVIHDPRAVTRFCDRVVFLEEGQLVADDTPLAALEAVAAAGRPAYAPFSHCPRWKHELVRNEPKALAGQETRWDPALRHPTTK